MFSEEISFTQNQKANENLIDSDGFAYQKNKMMPVKDRNYWTCVMRTKFHCPATTKYIYKRFLSSMFSIQRFVLFNVFPFDVLSHLAFFYSMFFPVNVSYDSTFWPSRHFFHSTFCPIPRFFHSTFFPIWHFVFQCFVLQRFLLSVFFTSTFCRWTV